ncbi:MAG: hypothetical protein ABI438_02965 [Dermatophilaceae bacterium]
MSSGTPINATERAARAATLSGPRERPGSMAKTAKPHNRGDWGDQRVLRGDHAAIQMKTASPGGSAPQ